LRSIIEAEGSNNLRRVSPRQANTVLLIECPPLVGPGEMHELKHLLVVRTGTNDCSSSVSFYSHIGNILAAEDIAHVTIVAGRLPSLVAFGHVEMGESLVMRQRIELSVVQEGGMVD